MQMPVTTETLYLAVIPSIQCPNTIYRSLTLTCC